MRLRDRGAGAEIWHAGSWVIRYSPDSASPRPVNTSTLVFRAADGTSWFVHSVPVVRGNARNESNDKLLLAYRSIKAGTDPKAKYRQVNAAVRVRNHNEISALRPGERACNHARPGDSPRSINLRMASGRETSPSCLLAHSSMRASNDGSTRTPINLPLPVFRSGPRLLPFARAFFAFAIWPSVKN